MVRPQGNKQHRAEDLQLTFRVSDYTAAIERWIARFLR
jgi:hypothetical protein